MVEPIFDYQFRLILIGDSTVGKSSLLKYFTDGKFAEVIGAPFEAINGLVCWWIIDRFGSAEKVNWIELMVVHSLAAIAHVKHGRVIFEQRANWTKVNLMHFPFEYFSFFPLATFRAAENGESAKSRCSMRTVRKISLSVTLFAMSSLAVWPEMTYMSHALITKALNSCELSSSSLLRNRVRSEMPSLRHNQMELCFRFAFRGSNKTITTQFCICSYRIRRSALTFSLA